MRARSGDGIVSAINFKLDIKRGDDPEGGSRAVITLDGKYPPTKPFRGGAPRGPRCAC